MDRDPDNPKYLEPYARAVESSGAGAFESLLWRSREFQQKRFEVMSQTVDLTGRVVIDFGCGHADFLAWLASNDVAYGRYHGVDGVPEMLEECRRRASDGAWIDAAFHHADFVADPAIFEGFVHGHGAEVFTFSGSLNTLPQHQALEVLDRAWVSIGRVSGGALLFNFLSGRGRRTRSDGSDPAHRFDPVAVLEWALARTPLVVFRQDYLEGHDATIALQSP